jgi:hypothetical protein
MDDEEDEHAYIFYSIPSYSRGYHACKRSFLSDLMPMIDVRAYFHFAAWDTRDPEAPRANNMKLISQLEKF